MKLRQWIAQLLERHKVNRLHAAVQATRKIPDSYFKGYRRLAQTESEIIGQHCWNCRHAIAHRTWWCDLGAGVSKGYPPCKWEPCHVADQLTRADLEAGGPNDALGHWIGLPPEPIANSEASK